MENLINLSQFTSLAAVTSNAIAEIGSGTTIAMATDSDAGIMKLYTSTGANEDGTMTQFEITKLIRNITVSGGSSTMTKISKLPSQAEAVTYNGSAQQASWDDFDATELIIDGEIEASDAGVHTVGFTPQADCMWLDGTQNRRTTTWSIDKAAGSLSISDNSTTLTTGDTDSFTIATVGDGAITVTSSDTSVATVSQSGSTVTVTAVAAGHTAITVSVAEGTNYLAPSDVTYNLTVQSNISNTLNNNSWQTISEISQAGDGDLYWDVGDAKEIILNGQIGDCFTATNLSLCVFILDFNHPMNGVAENNIIWGGFKSALIDGTDVSLIDGQTSGIDGQLYFNFNHTSTTVTYSVIYGKNCGGWRGSDLRYDILGATSTQPSEYNIEKTASCVGYDATAATLTNPVANTLLSALPADLRNVIRLWTRWIDATGNKSNTDAGIQATVDAITLLAESEIFASRNKANQYEQNHQTQMAYYANGNSITRYKHNDVNTAAAWWTASPDSSSSSMWCSVSVQYNAGKAGTAFQKASYGLAPAFKT